MTRLERSRYQIYPYHLVDPSPWPITISFSLLSLALSLGLTIHGYINNNIILYLSIILVLYNLALWLRDIIIEGTYLGCHTLAVRKGLNYGFILFVISEILIFLSIFWSYFHSAMSPNIEIGNIWPPIGIETISALELPLLNTIILLASGATITYSHFATINNNKNQALNSLLITLLLIIIFVICQFIEYTNAHFTITDGIYGSVFYTGTGLHFLHMNMLIIMLIICYWRMKNYHFTSTHHLNFETTILYLHILDIIWLFLYIIMYWWGN